MGEAARGSQYTSTLFRHPRRTATRAETRAMIFDYIEPERSGDRRSQTFYNPVRLHSALGYLSPVNFEKSIQTNQP